MVDELLHALDQQNGYYPRLRPLDLLAYAD